MLIGKIVLIDTFGEFEERLNAIAEFEPSAILLALHTDSAKTEGLDAESAEVH